MIISVRKVIFAAIVVALLVGGWVFWRKRNQTRFGLTPEEIEEIERRAAVASLAVPDPGDLAKLGKDAQLLFKFADAIDWVDTGNKVGLALAELLDDIPASASETQVKNDYIYPHFMNGVTSTPATGDIYVGIAGYLEAIDAEYQSYAAQIPDPLPFFSPSFSKGFLSQDERTAK